MTHMREFFSVNRSGCVKLEFYGVETIERIMKKVKLKKLVSCHEIFQ